MNNFAPATILTILLLCTYPGTSHLNADEALTGSAKPEAPGDGAVIEGNSTVEPSSADQSIIDPRAEAHNRFLRLNDEERYVEAAVAAEQVVTLTQAEFGADSMKMVNPLTNLATMQMHTNDLGPAEANFRRCISIIEKHEGRLSEQLVNPLNGLGATLNRAESYEQSVVVLERALRINHVNSGFYNISQFKIQDGLTESYVGLGDLEEANFYQEAQLEIYQRKSGTQDPEIVPGLFKLGAWYERSGQVDAAMQTYRKADTILRRRTSDGKANPDRVQALEGIAEVYERIGNQSAGASSLRSALVVIDSQPQIDYPKRAKVLVKLGDLYARTGKIETANESYEAAWWNLSRDDQYLDLRDFYFANPVRIAGRQLSTLKVAPNARGKGASPLAKGYVLIAYSVNSKGRADEVIVIESDPPGMMDKTLRSVFSRSHFRPRRVDGVAVDTDRLLYQLDFVYSIQAAQKDADDKDEALENPDDDEPQSRGGRIAYPEKATE